jgi:hypothetical protein
VKKGEFMAKEYFKSVRFRQTSSELIIQCEAIVTEYLAQGLRLTLRQLYYQLVTKNLITNEEKSYRNLSSLVSDARLAGMIDWGAIEDRIRVPSIPAEWSSIQSIVESALYSYRLPRWADQPYYVELWVEKDALAGVLRPLAKEYHVPMMVNRGYSSQSAMYEASKRFAYASIERFKKGSLGKLVLLYLGDFDPSGEDMVRDIRERLDMFGVSVDVRKIALTIKQVKKYKPPPNPTKRKDPRSADFISRYGASSWEVDAINPRELQKIIRSEMSSCVDQEMMDAIIKKEDDDKLKLGEAVKTIMKR